MMICNVGIVLQIAEKALFPLKQGEWIASSTLLEVLSTLQFSILGVLSYYLKACNYIIVGGIMKGQAKANNAEDKEN